MLMDYISSKSLALIAHLSGMIGSVYFQLLMLSVVHSLCSMDERKSPGRGKSAGLILQANLVYNGCRF